MTVTFLFSSPGGDITPSPETLTQPFLLSPGIPHPCLILKDYFDAITEFILTSCSTTLHSLLAGTYPEGLWSEGVNDIRIRSEKHGALYHLASVEVLPCRPSLKLSVSSAITPQGKACLTREYGILKRLNQVPGRSYLPQVYFIGDVAAPLGGETTVSFLMVLGQWFEDYHEWHLSLEGPENRQRVRIWDLKLGHRYASEEEAFEIFKQASRILTLYRDTKDFKQIHPWHHAAGDFVVKASNGRIDIKLTTARNYRSMMDFLTMDTVDPLIAWVYFFLDLTIRMRLDRLDGVGNTVFAEDFSVHATTEGFFEGLRILESEDLVLSTETSHLISVLQSFTVNELERLFEPLVRIYQANNPADFPVIQAHIQNHIKLLHQMLRDLRQ